MKGIGRICEFVDSEGIRCPKRSSYNFPDVKSLKYCNTHKLDGMINKATRRCEFEKCDKIPTYGYEGTKRAIFCLDHREDIMIDIKHKKCEFDKCDIRPSYNYEDNKIPKFCFEHKEETMVDVVSRKCKFEGCKYSCCFGYKEDMKPIFCSLHKSETMIDVYKRGCMFKGCEVTACYGNPGDSIRNYCASHKKEGMVDKVNINKMCLTSLCLSHSSNPLYEGYCVKCFMNLFPEKPLARNFKTKEREVVQFILKKYPGYKWSFDKVIEGGNSKRRPDVFLELEDKVLIIDIDENQHIGYDCSCENKRIMELSQDVKHKDMIFIRFNPDGYKTKTKLIKSCWTISKTGMCVLIPERKTEWDKRLDILQEQIDYWTKYNSNKNIEIIHLFYDQV